MNAKIRSLQFGKITTWQVMVTFVKTTLNLGINVIKNGGITVIIKSVENFVKRHVTIANPFRSNHFHTLPTLTTNYELNNG